jgi:hypothetical protein
MTLLGHEGAIAIETEAVPRNPCSPDGECTVAFADRKPHANEPYTKWTLTFSSVSGSTPAKLTDATREVVSSSEAETHSPATKP